MDQPRRHRHRGRTGRHRRRHLLESHAPARLRQRHTGWHAHAFPLSVDGVEIVASLVLLAGRRARRKSAWLPWAALTIGTAASLTANVGTADHGTFSRVIAGWPAVALLIAVKLLSGILEHRTAACDSAGACSDDSAGTPDSTDSRAGRPRPASSPADRPRSSAGQLVSGTHRDRPRRHRRAGAGRPSHT